VTHDPDLVVRSVDGTPIAVFRYGSGQPIVLVHGAASDHTTFRVVGPMLATMFAVSEIDRRGRGASGDGPDYAIEREFEDVAAVAAAVAGEAGVSAVAVVGHSFGGRVALGAARSGDAIDRLVVYEGAPPAPERPYQEAALLPRLRALREAGRGEALLTAFLAEVVGMTAADLEAYRANPVWPARVAAASTIVRELEAEASPAAGRAALGEVRTPVLQLLGGASGPSFHAATWALHERLADGRVEVIDGARHAAHHTHPDVLVAHVAGFLRQTP
jgi:pimeloyl-ACP methyl ester carboxylesterase